MNDEKIIAAIRNRDPSAINTVIETYSRLLWSIIRPILKHAAVQDMEECVADVFIQLWQSPEKYDPSRGTLKTWLSIVARTKAIDRCREMAKYSALSLEDDILIEEVATEDNDLSEETRTSLHLAVNSLEEPDREIIVRRYYLGQKPKMIAKVLGIPVKSVENRLYRSKQKLRRQISNNGGFHELV